MPAGGNVKPSKLSRPRRQQWFRGFFIDSLRAVAPETNAPRTVGEKEYVVQV
jgi:hypothetical protein